MTRAVLPFGEFLPDVAVLDNQATGEAKNVFPGANSYLPFPDLSGQSGGTIASSAGGNDSSTKILIHANGTDTSTTVPDSNKGGSSHTWTAAGNAQLDTAQFKFGVSSLLFDGTGDWITTPDHADFTLGSGEWTVDFWFRVADAGGAEIYAYGQGDNGATAASSSIRGGRSAANVMFAQAFVGGSTFNITGTTQFTNATNTGWHHYEFCRTGNTLRLFVDGTQEGGDVSISGTVNDSSNAFRIGALGEFTSTPWNGWIDEFRLSVGAARHTTTFTPSTVPYYVGGAARGIFAARKADGTYVEYAGTADSLLRYTGAAWQNVSKYSSELYALPSNTFWSFEQSGTKLVAVAGSTVAPQVIDVDSDTLFANLSGSPPEANHVKQIGDFLVLSNLSADYTKRTIQWSAVNDITGWTVGTSLSDVQTFPDGGDVMGVAGSEIAYVVQERAIRLMQFLPGDTDRIFAFSRIADGKGCISKYGFVTVADVLYYISEDGFYALAGNQLQPIGAHKVNQWFKTNSDSARRNLVQAFWLADRPRVGFAFHNSSQSTEYDRVLVFDIPLMKWSYAALQAQIWGPAPDANQRLLIGAFDEVSIYSILNGGNLAATVDTTEAHLAAPKRAFVNNAYLIGVEGVATATITPYTRERLASNLVTGSAVSIEANGEYPVLSSARLHKFRATVPAGTGWSNLQGVGVDFQPDGEA